MITQNLPTLKIHKLTQEQYDREFAAGRIDPNAIYLTPDEGNSAGGYFSEDTNGNITLSDGAGNTVLQSTGNGFAANAISVQQLTINGQTIQEMIQAYVNQALLGGAW